MWHLNNEIIDKPKPLTIGDTQHGKDIFTKWSEAELNVLGIYTLTIIKPAITDITKKYGTPDRDFANHTITYPIVAKSAERLAVDQKNAARKVYQKAMREMEDSDKLMPRITEDLIDLLILNGTILINDLPDVVQTRLTDRKAKRAALPANPDPAK